MLLLATIVAAGLTIGSSPLQQGQPGTPQVTEVELSTAVDHPAWLGGRLVRLLPVRVSRIISGTLVELRDAREDGPYNFNHFDEDRLFAVLPAGSRFARGDVIVVEGWLRTVRGATLSGELQGVAGDRLNGKENQPIVVAAHAATADRVSLAGR